MAFVLSEAYVTIKSQGFDSFTRKIKSVEDKLESLGKKTDNVGDKLQRGFNKTNFSKVESQLENVNKEFKKLDTHPRPSTIARQKELAKGIDKVEENIKDVNKAFNNSGVYRDKGGRLRDAKGRFVKLGDSIGGAGRSAGKFNNNFRNTRYSLVHAGYALKALPKDMRFVVSGMADIGTAAASGLGAIPIAASAATLALVSMTSVMIKSVGIASKLETGLAEVATISGDVAADIDGFATELGKLSIATRTETGLLSAGLYQTISAGITDTADAMMFLEVGANAARAGLSSVEVAISGLTSAVSSYGYKASEVDIVADKFFKTVEVGKLKFEDLSSSIGKVAPLASQLGISLDELLATGSALTLTGSTLTQSFTSLQGIMNAVLRPSSKAVKLAKDLGLEFNVTALRTKGLSGFLADLVEKTDGNIETMGQLFGRVEGLRGVIALTGSQSEAFAKNLDAIANSAGATDKAVAIQNQTFQAQVDLLKNQLSFVLQQIGAELLPVLTTELERFSKTLSDTDWTKFRNDVKDIVSVLKELYEITKTTVKVIGMLPGVKAIQIASDAGRKTGEAIQQGNYGQAAVQSARGAFAPVLATPVLGERTPKPFQVDPKLLEDKSQFNIGKTVALPGTEAEKKYLEKIHASSEKDEKTAETNVETAKKMDAVVDDFGVEVQAMGVAFKNLAQDVKVGKSETQSIGTGDFRGMQLNALDVVDPTMIAKNIDEVQQGLGRVSDATKTFENTSRTGFAAVETETKILGKTTGVISDKLGKSIGNIITETEKLPNTVSEINQVNQEIVDANKRMGETLEALSNGLRDSPIGDMQLSATGGPSSYDINQQRIESEREIKPIISPKMQMQLENAGLDLAGSFQGVSSAIQGGFTGGLPGALIAFGTELVFQTKGFQRIQSMWNDLFGKMVMAIEPVITVIADALEPVFEELGDTVKELEPVFYLLGNILKLTLVPAAKHFASAIQVITYLWDKLTDAIRSLINLIPGVDIKDSDDPDFKTRENPSRRRTFTTREGSSPVNQPRAEGRSSGRKGERISDEQQRGRQERGDVAVTQGISISRITGSTRDILLDALRPLRQLDNVFPKMLLELQNIRSVLTPGHRPPSQSAAPGVPNQRGDFVNRQQDFVNNRQDTINQDGLNQNAIIVETLNINIEQVTDLDVDEIQRELNLRLDLVNRGRGLVFQANQ